MLPRQNSTIFFNAVNPHVVTAQSYSTSCRLFPIHRAVDGINASYGGLEGANTNLVTLTAGTVDQIHQTLDIVGATWRGHWRIPDHITVGWIHPSQMPGLSTQ